jgi:malate dehydrogenase (oxaloacetate-decarboxylating)
VPEIWPHEAKEEGALVVATGRGDFPNQVNNSLCFPGLLKGVLIARARAVSDGMALACARAIAERAKARGLSPDSIVPTMEDAGLFSEEAGVVAEKAAEEGLARRNIPRAEASAKAERDIARARASYRALLDAELVDRIDEGDLAAMLEEAVREARADTGAAR